MTDKEQIIIDGINVTNCNHIIAYDPPPEQGTWGGAIHKGACKICSKDCKYNPDCDYKQLARKTQECENLKAEEKYLKQCCQKAGEELAKHSFEYDGKEKNLVVQAIELNEKYEKLKKALEEIEEYTREQFCENCDDYNTTEYNSHCEYCEYYEYFDIINKSKRR